MPRRKRKLAIKNKTKHGKPGTHRTESHRKWLKAVYCLADQINTFDECSKLACFLDLTEGSANLVQQLREEQPVVTTCGVAAQLLTKWLQNSTGQTSEEKQTTLGTVLCTALKRKDLAEQLEEMMKTGTIARHPTSTWTMAIDQIPSPVWKSGTGKVCVVVCVFSALVLSLVIIFSPSVYLPLLQNRRISESSPAEFPLDKVQLARQMLRKAHMNNAKDNDAFWKNDNRFGEDIFFNVELRTKDEAMAAMRMEKRALVDTPDDILPLYPVFDSVYITGFQSLIKVFAADPNDRKQPDMVLIFGDSGTGKTFTFCKMLPFYWANEVLYKDTFQLLFTAYLGDPAVLSAQTLQELLFARIGAELPQSVKTATFDFVARNPSKVLLVLDAFDEVDSGKLSSLLERLLRGEGLPGLRTIVTTRPKLESDYLVKKSDRVFELLGLTERDIPNYFAKYLGSKEKALNLIKALNSAQIKRIQGLLKSPLIASMICDIFQENKVLPPTGTMLYNDIVLNMIKDATSSGELKRLDVSSPTRRLLSTRSIMSLSSRNHNISDQLLLLGSLALSGFRQGRAVFSFHRVENCTLGVRSGILLPMVRKRGSGIVGEIFTFRHFSFLEFFLAYRVARECADKGRDGCIQFIEMNKIPLKSENEMELSYLFFLLGLAPIDLQMLLLSRVYSWPSLTPPPLFSWPYPILPFSTIMEATYPLIVSGKSILPSLLTNGVQVSCYRFKKETDLARQVLRHPALSDIFIMAHDGNKYDEQKFTPAVDDGILQAVENQHAGRYPMWSNQTFLFDTRIVFEDGKSDAYFYWCKSLRLSGTKQAHLCIDPPTRWWTDYSESFLEIAPQLYCSHPNCLFTEGVQKTARSHVTFSVSNGYEKIASLAQTQHAARRLYQNVRMRKNVLVVAFKLLSTKIAEPMCASLRNMLTTLFHYPTYLTQYYVPSINIYPLEVWSQPKCQRLARLLVKLTGKSLKNCSKIPPNFWRSVRPNVQKEP